MAVEIVHGSSIRRIKPRRRWLWRIVRLGFGTVLIGVVSITVLIAGFLNRVPSAYRLLANPLAPPAANRYDAMELPGFESPYLGHTGSADGAGGAMFGGSKGADLDQEAAMGLRWTFLPVNWRKIEAEGPVNLSQPNCDQTRELDEFVNQARRRKLNILLQIVIGGNSGGPPDWAGRREPGKSAPRNMVGAGEFAGRLAERYAPGGVLAKRDGWGVSYGVRAWELDNEPESYRTNWKGQEGDYSEFVTRAKFAIRKVDPKAMIAVAATSGGGHASAWLERALDAHALHGSMTFGSAAVPYSIGQAADIVSFHCYEGLETSFNRADRTIVDDFEEVQTVFDKWESRSEGFQYAHKMEYWHTEGNFDFLGVLSAKRRAAWRMQFMTRAFAAGISKVCVMDPSEPERAAVKAYVEAMPRPFPMEPADSYVKVLRGSAAAFWHRDPNNAKGGRVWIVWAKAGTGTASIQLPTLSDQVTVVRIDGERVDCGVSDHRLVLEVPGDAKMAAPMIVIDCPESSRN
jgi:hypothetical protein